MAWEKLSDWAERITQPHPDLTGSDDIFRARMLAGLTFLAFPLSVLSIVLIVFAEESTTLSQRIVIGITLVLILTTYFTARSRSFEWVGHLSIATVFIAPIAFAFTYSEPNRAIISLSFLGVGCVFASFFYAPLAAAKFCGALVLTMLIAGLHHPALTLMDVAQLTILVTFIAVLSVMGAFTNAQHRAQRQELLQRMVETDRKATLGDLSTAMAHEVKNALGYVSGNLTWLNEVLAHRTQGSEEDLQEAAQDAALGAQRIAEIMSAVQGYGKGEAQAAPVPVHLRAVLDSALRLAAPQLRNKAQVVTELDGDPQVLGSEGKLGQVFLNLFINAAHALNDDENAKISIRLFAQEDKAVVEVNDNGSGMTRAVQAQIFEPFFTTKPDGIGTGLGLAVCKDIVTAANGEIFCDSAPSAGTSFTVRLPLADEAHSTHEAAEDLPQVLVVDDDPEVLKALARSLRGFSVTTASSGAEMLEACAARRFDAILCDVTMPQMNGMEVYDVLKSTDESQADRMLFITGGIYSPEILQRVKDCHRPLLKKPIHPADLIEKLSAVIHQ